MRRGASAADERGAKGVGFHAGADGGLEGAGEELGGVSKGGTGEAVFGPGSEMEEEVKPIPFGEKKKKKKSPINSKPP